MRNPYVFRTKGGREFAAAGRLLRFGVLPVNPCAYFYVRKNNKGDPILEAKPMLPGYFVGLFPGDKWWQIKNACFDDGSRVLGPVLSPDGMMRPLHDSTYRTIMDLNSYSADAPIIERQRGLKAGDTVILRSGPHAGKRFRLQWASKAGDKAKIVTKFLGALREVEIAAEAVDLVDTVAA